MTPILRVVIFDPEEVAVAVGGGDAFSGESGSFHGEDDGFEGGGE